ncbi:MAG: type 4a pilus biogenesis protein PilO [Candidatus Omnitrophica bacterium]|nr:type 4a pilus biogenesis protein PilO [Candidatus Omnitrophota bacterium]
MDKLIDFKKLKFREKILLIGLMAAVGFGVYAQTIHKPLSRKIAQFKFQIEKSQSRLDEMGVKFPQIDRQKQNIQSLNAECENLLSEIDKIEKKLPSKRNTSHLLGEFTRMAKDVRLTSIRQKMEVGDEYSRIFIELKFNALYKEAINYIKNIESVSPFLSIEELDISEPNAKKVDPDIPVRIVVSSLLGEELFAEKLKVKEMEKAIQVTRDIFISKARPADDMVRKTELKLEGITFRRESPTAIINSDVVKVGSKIGNLTVKQVLPDAVVLSDGVEDHVLSIER